MAAAPPAVARNARRDTFPFIVISVTPVIVHANSIPLMPAEAGIQFFAFAALQQNFLK
jgi:hypothetical protein